MELSNVFCYFSPVAKGSTEDISDKIKHTIIGESHDVYLKMLQLIASVKKECDLNIIFTSTGENQNNETRNMIINIIREKTVSSGIPLVAWLSKNTDNKSKSGLVFILLGKNNNSDFFILARFPAEEGIVINDKRNGIKVQVLDEVFLKNSHRYKMAYFEGISLKGDFWKGLAVDKQINESAIGVREVSEYWIKDFLKCDLEMTSKRGSILVAKSLRSILGSKIEDTDKEKIIEAAISVKTLNGKKTTIRKMIDDLGIEKNIANKIIDQLPNREVADKVFHFDVSYFTGIFNLRVKYLNTGAVIMAPNEEFDNIFNQNYVAESGMTRYITEGFTTNEAVRTKI